MNMEFGVEKRMVWMGENIGGEELMKEIEECTPKWNEWWIVMENKWIKKVYGKVSIYEVL